MSTDPPRAFHFNEDLFNQVIIFDEELNEEGDWTIKSLSKKLTKWKIDIKELKKEELFQAYSQFKQEYQDYWKKKGISIQTNTQFRYLILWIT
jgi:hypothetical protein